MKEPNLRQTRCKVGLNDPKRVPATQKWVAIRLFEKHLIFEGIISPTFGGELDQSRLGTAYVRSWL